MSRAYQLNCNQKIWRAHSTAGSVTIYAGSKCHPGRRQPHFPPPQSDLFTAPRPRGGFTFYLRGALCPVTYFKVSLSRHLPRSRSSVRRPPHQHLRSCVTAPANNFACAADIASLSFAKSKGRLRMIISPESSPPRPTISP